MTESPMDYYSQLRVLGKFQGMTSRGYRNRYCQTGGFMGRQIVGFKEATQPELIHIIDSCSFRALKKDWRKDLPPQQYAAVHLEMTDKQHRHYQTMMEEFYVELEHDDVSVDLVLTQQGKLAQISSGLVMKDGKVHWLEEPKKLPKLKALFDLIDGGPGKVIVSYMHKASGEMLMEELAVKGYEPAYIRGGMQPEELKRQKDWFNNNPGCRVLVGQQVATARGHTLTGTAGDRCDRIVMYENHQGLYWREQIKDRNHRGDQDQPCTVWDFISSPMEQLNVDRLTGKRSKAEALDAMIAEIRKTSK